MDSIFEARERHLLSYTSIRFRRRWSVNDNHEVDKTSKNMQTPVLDLVAAIK